MHWQVRAVRGATTASANTPTAIHSATLELVQAVTTVNNLEPATIISATFSVTADLDAIFPAQVARSFAGWQFVPLLDVQQMAVKGDLARCIRLLLHINSLCSQQEIKHIYLRGAQNLRPDLKNLL